MFEQKLIAPANFFLVLLANVCNNFAIHTVAYLDLAVRCSWRFTLILQKRFYRRNRFMEGRHSHIYMHGKGCHEKSVRVRMNEFNLT